ncbi:unnamed protein product [Aspergillus oryzae]|uniref:Unnamed protein product n=1 Tax=Aspergillus oryzae TaxID=5062 RepID=A0AAN5BWB7_ASPOZ|nr:unnamed protein product [Aspergillus oryzae]
MFDHSKTPRIDLNPFQQKSRCVGYGTLTLRIQETAKRIHVRSIPAPIWEILSNQWPPKTSHWPLGDVS